MDKYSYIELNDELERLIRQINDSDSDWETIGAYKELYDFLHTLQQVKEKEVYGKAFSLGARISQGLHLGYDWLTHNEETEQDIRTIATIVNREAEQEKKRMAQDTIQALRALKALLPYLSNAEIRHIRTSSRKLIEELNQEKMTFWKKIRGTADGHLQEIINLVCYHKNNNETAIVKKWLPTVITDYEFFEKTERFMEKLKKL